MGAFEVITYMLRTIYSRFKHSGIIEILAEAAVGTRETIRVAMEGSDVKQVNRYLILLYEALF